MNSTLFKKGTGGRPKGSPNKTTIEVKEFISNFLNENLLTLQSDFDNLESKERLYFMEKLLKYVIPIKAEPIIKEIKNEYAEMTDEQLRSEIERISNK